MFLRLFIRIFGKDTKNIWTVGHIYNSAVDKYILRVIEILKDSDFMSDFDGVRYAGHYFIFECCLRKKFEDMV